MGTKIENEVPCCGYRMVLHDIEGESMDMRLVGDGVTMLVTKADHEHGMIWMQVFETEATKAAAEERDTPFP